MLWIRLPSTSSLIAIPLPGPLLEPGQSSIVDIVVDIGAPALAIEFPEPELCIDADEVIQRELKLSIREIFEREGEEGFRRREREVIAKIASSPPAVMSVGGGAVLDKANVEVLAKILEKESS